MTAWTEDTWDGGKSTMVQRDDSTGTMVIPGAAEPEAWDRVREVADSVDRDGDLMGWGEYTGLYRVVVGNVTLWYMVAEG